MPGSIGWLSPAPRLHIDDCFEVNVATFRMGSARVYLHTACAFEMTIKTLDQRLTTASLSRAQQRIFEQNCGRLRAAWSGRYYPCGPATCRHPAWSDTTNAAPAPLIEHVIHATPSGVEHVPRTFQETDEIMRLASPAPTCVTSANDGKRGAGTCCHPWRTSSSDRTRGAHEACSSVQERGCFTRCGRIMDQVHRSSSWHLLLVPHVRTSSSDGAPFLGAFDDGPDPFAYLRFSTLKVEWQLYDKQEVTDESGQRTRWLAANAATAVRCFQLCFRMYGPCRDPWWHDRWRRNACAECLRTTFNTASRWLAVILKNIRASVLVHWCRRKGNCPRWYSEHVLLVLITTAQSISATSDKEKTHGFPDDNIINDGAKRFRCVEMVVPARVTGSRLYDASSSRSVTLTTARICTHDHFPRVWWAPYKFLDRNITSPLDVSIALKFWSSQMSVAMKPRSSKTFSYENVMKCHVNTRKPK